MPDGRIKHVHEQGQTYYDDAGKPLRSVGTVQDVTARKQAEARMQQLSRAVEQTADSIVITDKRGAIEYVNQAFEQITGYSASEALGQTPRLVKSGVHDAEFYRRLWATIERGEVFRDVLVNRRRNGELYFEEKTITPLRDEAGEITHYISTGKDITERMQVQERLQYLAHHDALTELPNRVLFMDRLTHALTRAQWHERVVAVLFLDLDRFKYINDTFGHNVGDKFLQHMAARLKSCVREGDTVARLGGDEFALLLEDVGQVADIAPVADKLLAALAAPFVLEGREFFVTTSIGISLYPADGVDGQTLLKHADTAMYRAKDLGRNNYQFYSADLSAKAFERLTLETSLRRALERDEFLLYYQPQVDIKSQRLIGVEVLIRWRHPELGVVSPTQFIPLAEETGLIVPIGEWVLRSACTQARAWRAAGLGFGSITVNISGRQFADPALAARIGQVLSDTKLDAGLLELEITESVVMHDPQSAVHTLEQLNAMGVRIAIDDFGTGYSSLAYLKRYPIDTLKVDQSFVRDVTHDPNDASIVQAIIAMARSMQLRVIAEGVETEEQLTFLRTHGCEAVQGYLFSRPVPAEEARELIARGRFSSMPARAR
jgi:diguanylate cyclase (GGDEF)-like protein/PAS domain S-box-containing protein